MVQSEKISGFHLQDAKAPGQSALPHSVQNGERTLLELLPHRAVAALCRVRGCGSRLDGKGQIRIARFVGANHRGVAREVCGDAEFLLRPVDIREPQTALGTDERAQPDRRAEEKL